MHTPDPDLEALLDEFRYQLAGELDECPIDDVTFTRSYNVFYGLLTEDQMTEILEELRA